jgi:DNA repair protein RecN (Recombination protein N)
MLLELAVTNVAIIDRLVLEFRPGFTALTGETGAGKSILIGALDLLLGGRASADLVRTGEDEAVVEARFDVAGEADVKRLLSDGGFEGGDELVVRRSVSRLGRGKASLNGRMAPVALLRDVGTRLLNIYGQHEHQSLLSVERHLDLLDAFGGHGGLRAAVEADYAALSSLRDERARLETADRERAQREDMLRFQIAEIERAKLRAGEEDELRARRNVLIHVRKLREIVEEGERLLYQDEGAVHERLATYGRRVAEAVAIDADFAAAERAVAQALLHIEEARASLRDAEGRLEFDPGELQEIDDRVALVRELRRKYGADVPEVLAHLERARAELDAIAHSQERREALAREYEAARVRLFAGAESLTGARRAAADRLASALRKELATLEMKGAVFQAALAPIAAGEGIDAGGLVVGPRGADRAEFLLSANLGEEPRPVARIASGGELSRIMLALKRVLERSERVPTLIFDEVDAGIGGQVAEVVGQKLMKVAADHQVLVVTHLPQIARWADHHFHVGKATLAGRTRTEIRVLRDGERVREIARMLAGKQITDRALAHAREMLGPRV